VSDPATKIAYLPEALEGLGRIATNLAWRWDREARSLFKAIDATLWSLTWHNPIELLRRVEPSRLANCARDPDFIRLYERVLGRLERMESAEGTWYQQLHPELAGRPIAYFCAEFGLHNSVPIYSGGLGVLAGDHCKAASDLGIPLVGVGLFYRKGYFDQRITTEGWQEDTNETLDPANTPLFRLRTDDNGGRPRVLARVRMSGRDVAIGAWRMRAGRVPIYLLDTNLEENTPEDRELTQRLYGSGQELRLKQELILGVGGVRVLRAVDVHPEAWHANEGHAAFMMVERLREELAAGTALDRAVERVRARTVFTTHTPVPAGHDSFSTGLMESVLSEPWDDLGLSRESFLALGSSGEDAPPTFHMTAAAIRLSAQVNGVSKLHGQVTRRNWGGLWPDREPAEVPIGDITNGVHLPSWTAHRYMELFDREVGPEWEGRLDEPDLWSGVPDFPDEAVWEVHLHLKEALLNHVREQARRRWKEKWEEAIHLVGAGTLLSAEPLTIGFARRFATYKRADLIFRDEERLRRLLTDPWRPVQLVFAGKAHPADDEAKRILQRVYSFTRESRFEGRVAFVEDYEMHLAHRMVQGVDLWLNLPRLPLEASGTSGMKAALNFVPQLSTLDGWWAEGYNGDNGWAIPVAEQEEDADAHDHRALMELLEREVVPLYYDRDERGLPVGWIRVMKEAFEVAVSRFTTRRMVQAYAREHYAPALRDEVEDRPPTVSPPAPPPT